MATRLDQPCRADIVAALVWLAGSAVVAHWVVRFVRSTDTLVYF